LFLAGGLAACDDGGGGGDKPRPDAVTVDAARPDAAPHDAAPRDSAPPADAAPADAAPPADAARDAAPPAPDGATHAPPADMPPPALFGPGTPGAGAFDPALAALVDAWFAVPTDEPGAQQEALALRESTASVRRGGAAAADRIADVCDRVPVEDRGRTLVCLRLLALVDSPRSLDLLDRRARTPVPPWPAGSDPTEPAPQALARQVALQALAERGREGTAAAVDLLLRFVADPEVGDRDQGVAAVYHALPRIRAKARLRAVLPADEMYRLYESR
jgi:hypothetical protein